MAQSQTTPGVIRKEIDLSEVAAAAGTSVGATVGYATKGITNNRKLLSRDQEFVETFGEPRIGPDYAGFGAMEYLKESDALFFIRAVDGSETYANLFSGSTSGIGTGNDSISATSSTLISGDGNKPDDILDILSKSSAIRIASIGPGSYGNNVGVTITVSGDAGHNDFKDKYNNPELVYKIDVLLKADSDPDFSAVSGSPLESFFVSNKYMKDPSGKQLFAERVVNGVSKYIFIRVDASLQTAGDIPQPVVATGLTGGGDGSNGGSLSQLVAAWGLFEDRNKSNINILIAAVDFSSGGIVSTEVARIAASRKDCIAAVQIDDVDDITTAAVLANTLGYAGASYVAQYSGWDKVFDTFTDRIILIPKSIYGAVVMARTDTIANTWDAPAGTNRGVLSSVGQNVIWSDTQIGVLYEQNINTSRFIRGTGNVLWGQKTAQKKKSALDRINVRRLLLYVENSVEPSLQPFLFEANTTKNRLRIFNIVDAFMRTIGPSGLTRYQVVVDESNNTPQVIDNNEIVVDIFVQPAKSIEYIKLNTIITRTSVDFSEVI